MNRKDKLTIFKGFVDIFRRVDMEELSFSGATDLGLKLLELFETKIRQDQERITIEAVLDNINKDFKDSHLIQLVRITIKNTNTVEGMG